MRPVSSAWASTLQGSHDMLVRATVCSTFQTGTTPSGTRVDILDGAVTLDGTAQVRSTLDLTVDGGGMWPRFADDLYAPYGNEIYIERGLRYSDTLVEYCGLGYFRIDTPEQDDPPNGPIRITGGDRMQGIIDGRLLAPVQFLAGTTLGAIVTQLVTEIYPDATIEWDDATDAETITRPLIADNDRYSFLNDLVTAQGKIWYWDHRGVLVIKDLPDPDSPVADIFAGRHGVLVDVKRNITRLGVYNAVVASGEGADSVLPARGVAVDNNPHSPTYFYGRFGQVPEFFSSAFLLTNVQAENAARSILLKQLGLPYSVSFGSVPNPALEPFDAVRVRPGRDEGRETHVIDTLTIPLTEGVSMAATTREQAVTLVGTV